MSIEVCQHQWKLIDKTMMQSPWKRLGFLMRIVADESPSWMLREKLVITVQCEACGEIKQYVETNP